MLHTILTLVLVVCAAFFGLMILSITRGAQRRARIKHEHDREPFTDGRR